MNSCDYEQIVVHAELFAKFSPNIYKIKFKSSCKGIAFHSIYNYITGIQSTTHKCHSQQPITAQRHPSHSNLHSLECVLCSVFTLNIAHLHTYAHGLRNHSTSCSKNLLNQISPDIRIHALAHCICTHMSNSSSQRHISCLPFSSF